MGQYFKLVNIDKKRELYNEDGLKLMEILLNGPMQQLVGLLKKPKWSRFKIPGRYIQSSKAYISKYVLQFLRDRTVASLT